MNAKVCKHWDGIIHSRCGKGVKWRSMFDNALGCLGKEENGCSCYKRHTKEEIVKIEQIKDVSIQKMLKMLKENKSSCCGADIDISHVIKEGTYKGHGSRFCSECKKHLYHV